MNHVKTSARALLGAIVLVTLAACGGGGGDSRPKEDPGNQQPSSAPGLQLSTQQVALSSEHGDADPSSVVNGVVNNATAPVYVYVRHTDRGIRIVTFEQTSDTGGQLTLRYKTPQGLTPGLYTDSVVLDVCYDSQCYRPVTGSPKTVNVSYTVAAGSPSPALMLSREAVAFTQAPFAARLTQQIAVEQSGTQQGQWSATTTAAWLAVTPSGMPGSPLQLTADPQGLAPGQYLTWVEVTTNSPANTRPARIRVGLFVSATASANTFVNTLGDQVLVDPVRPHVYSMHNSVIAVDHLHTGQRLGTLSVPGRQLGDMAISLDGTRLLVADADRSKVWRLNTDTLTVGGSYELPPNGPFNHETRRKPAVLKVNGRNVMVVQGLQAHETYSGYYMVDLDSGVPLAFRFGASSYDTVHVAPDGRHFMIHTSLLSPNRLFWGEMAENSKGTVFVTRHGEGNTNGANGLEYISSDIVAGNSVTESFTCQGRITRPYPNQIYVDRGWVNNLSWQSPQPTHDAYFGQRCGGIEPYDTDHLFIVDERTTEFQVVAHDGTFVRRWLNTSGLIQAGSALKLSSDQLRVFDNQALQDLPR